MLVILQAKTYVETANTTELARHTRIQDIHNPDYSFIHHSHNYNF